MVSRKVLEVKITSLLKPIHLLGETIKLIINRAYTKHIIDKNRYDSSKVEEILDNYKSELNMDSLNFLKVLVHKRITFSYNKLSNCLIY